MTDMTCGVAHRIECSEIWGGNRGDALDVETEAVRASLFSRACDGCQGGDIYYFSVCSTGELTRLAVVDVLGHGDAVSATSQWLYESLVRHMNSPDNTAVLADLNRASVDRGLSAMSTAAVAGFFRSSNRLCFAYAGHHELLLGRRDTPRWVPVGGHEPGAFRDIPLGVHPEAEFQQSLIELCPGDRILVYTDGVVEAPDAHDEPFGLDRLIDTLEATAGIPLEDVRARLLDRLLVHTGQSLSHDDVTFVVVEIAP